MLGCILKLLHGAARIEVELPCAVHIVSRMQHDSNMQTDLANKPTQSPQRRHKYFNGQSHEAPTCSKACTAIHYPDMPQGRQTHLLICRGLCPDCYCSRCSRHPVDSPCQRRAADRRAPHNGGGAGAHIDHRGRSHAGLAQVTLCSDCSLCELWTLSEMNIVRQEGSFLYKPGRGCRRATWPAV